MMSPPVLEIERAFNLKEMEEERRKKWEKKDERNGIKERER